MKKKRIAFNPPKPPPSLPPTLAPSYKTKGGGRKKKGKNVQLPLHQHSIWQHGQISDLQPEKAHSVLNPVRCRRWVRRLPLASREVKAMVCLCVERATACIQFAGAVLCVFSAVSYMIFIISWTLRIRYTANVGRQWRQDVSPAAREDLSGGNETSLWGEI